MRLERINEEDATTQTSYVWPSLNNDFLLNTRRIFLVGEIDDYLATRVINLLQYFASVNPELPVYLYISSEGGCLDAGYCIIDFIKMMPYNVHTIISSYAYSMAAILAAYGTPKCRHIARGATAMLHNPLVELASDGVNQQATMADFLKRDCDTRIVDLAKVMKKDLRSLQELLTQNLWMNSKSAIKHGLVDSLWTQENEKQIIKEASLTLPPTEKDKLNQLGEVLHALAMNIKENQSWTE